MNTHLQMKGPVGPLVQAPQPVLEAEARVQCCAGVRPPPLRKVLPQPSHYHSERRQRREKPKPPPQMRLLDSWEGSGCRGNTGAQRPSLRRPEIPSRTLHGTRRGQKAPLLTAGRTPGTPQGSCGHVPTAPLAPRSAARQHPRGQPLLAGPLVGVVVRWGTWVGVEGGSAGGCPERSACQLEPSAPLQWRRQRQPHRQQT